MKTAKKKLGRPPKDPSSRKKKNYVRVYDEGLEKIKKNGFSSLQDFVDRKIGELP